MDDYLQTANLALEEWHKRCRDLQQDKESLLKEIDEAKEKRDTEIVLTESYQNTSSKWQN